MKRTGKRVRVEGEVRAAQLDKILTAEVEIESCLLTLKQHFDIPWTDPAFKCLAYLVRLARKAP